MQRMVAYDRQIAGDFAERLGEALDWGGFPGGRERSGCSAGLAPKTRERA